MAKRITQLSELTTAAQDDYIVIVDTSTGQTKKITVKNLNGLPDVTWTATGETWSYSAWSSTLKRGTLTIPTDGTTKYQKGMFVRFSQATGGVKYGKIVSVTSTSMVVYMGSYTLNNEAISSPVYSPFATPIGVPEKIITYKPFSFLVYRVAAWTTPSGFGPIPCDTASYDNNGSVDLTTNKGRFTVPVTGIYRFTARFHELGSVSGNIIICSVAKNGTESARGSEDIAANTGNRTASVSAQMSCTAGDYIEGYAYGSARSAGTGLHVTAFDGELIEER